MAELNITMIVALAEDNKLEEAAKIINEYVDSFSPADYGSCYVALATAYLEMEAANQKKLSAILERQLMQLKALDREERTRIEELELEELRNKLN